MEQVVNMIINNGCAVGLLIYFIYKDNKFTDTINKALTNISDSMDVIKDILTNKGVKK